MTSRPHVRLLGLSLATVLGLVGLGPTAPTAQAAPSDFVVADRPDEGVTADGLPTTQIDGVAWDQKVAGNTVFVGGEFRTARPAGAAPGTSTTPRANMLAYDITTGELKTDFVADTNATVNALALSPDKRTLYIGGSFTTVNGKNRYRIAAINTADGSLVNSFAPTIDASVHAIVATNDTVYVGGVFSRANGQARTRLAAFSAADGSLRGWAPTANRQVRAMVMTPDNSRVVIGGLFSGVNGYSSPGTASLDAASGDLYSFAMNRTITNGTSNTGIYSLQTDGKQIVASAFNYGEAKYEGIVMADPYSGRITWLADCHGDAYDATVMGAKVYSVSHAHNCENIGSFPQIDDYTFKTANAYTYDATHTVTYNAYSGYGNYQGHPAPSHVNWFPELTGGTYTGTAQAAWTSESDDRYLVVGGEFPRVNGTGQQGLVRFARPGISPAKQGPRVNSGDLTPSTTVRGTSVALEWKTAWDRDNKKLTYLVMRDDKGSTPVATLEADSLWWDRPTMSYTDATMEEGRTYRYQIIAQDSDGNRAYGKYFSVTAGQAVPSDKYFAAVSADRPSHLWRLGEASGSLALDSAGDNNLAFGWDVYRNRAGILQGDAATQLGGSSSSLGGAASLEQAPAEYSSEAWVKTTTTSGGVILNQGSSRTGSSAITDREVYMTNAGQFAWSVYSGGARRAVISPLGTRYNDGRWHHVVTSLSSEGMKLFVDGELKASDARWTTGDGRSAYWRVGGDSQLNLASAPTARWFAGTVDEVAIYPKALDASMVRKHAAAGGLTVVDPTPVETPQPTDPATDPTDPATDPTDPVEAGVFASDDFTGTRTRWGSATTGGAWTYSAGSSTFTTVDGQGLVKLSAGQTANAALPQTAGRDVVVDVDVTADQPITGGGMNVMLAARRTAAGEYRAKLRLFADGTANIAVSRINNGERVLREVSLKGGWTPGKSVHVQLKATGEGSTELVANAWTDPAVVSTATATDTTPALQTSGAVGFVAYASGTATTVPVLAVDNLKASRTA